MVNIQALVSSGFGIFYYNGYESIVELLCEDDLNVQPSILIHPVQRVLAHGTIPQSQSPKVIPLIPVDGPKKGTRLLRAFEPRVEGKIQYHDRRA